MQRVTSSEVRVTGPTHFDVALPHPPTKLNYYRDIAAITFPATATGARIENIEAKCGFNGDVVLSSRKASNSTNGDVPRGRWLI